MLIEASLNNQLTGITLINNSNIICKYLTPLPENPKGRMKKPKAGIRRTREKFKNGGAIKLGMEIADSDSENEAENTPTIPTTVIIPNDEPQANNIFCYAALADKQQDTLYTDATGAFPEMSLDGKPYLFVAYDYNTNYIFALPIANVQDKTIIEAFDKVFTKQSSIPFQTLVPRAIF